MKHCHFLCKRTLTSNGVAFRWVRVVLAFDGAWWGGNGRPGLTILLSTRVPDKQTIESWLKCKTLIRTFHIPTLCRLGQRESKDQKKGRVPWSLSSSSSSVQLNLKRKKARLDRVALCSSYEQVVFGQKRGWKLDTNGRTCSRKEHLHCSNLGWLHSSAITELKLTMNLELPGDSEEVGLQLFFVTQSK